MTPTLLLGCDVFMTLLVSLPVYITRPRAVPDATTVLDHRIFSTFKESSCGSSSVCNTQKKIEIVSLLLISFSTGDIATCQV